MIYTSSQRLKTSPRSGNDSDSTEDEDYDVNYDDNDDDYTACSMIRCSHHFIGAFDRYIEKLLNVSFQILKHFFHH